MGFFTRTSDALLGTHTIMRTLSKGRKQGQLGIPQSPWAKGGTCVKRALMICLPKETD
jgi:hypothetical protein